MEVYVVGFSSGAYENYYDYRVKAFLLREDAEKFVARFNALLVENNAHYSSKNEEPKFYMIEELNLRTDYTGGKFWMEKLPCE